MKKSWYFLKQQNGLKYFPGATEAKPIRTKCKFYNYETRKPIPSEEVFDKYLIPYIFGNILNGDVRIVNGNTNCKTSNSGNNGIKITEILNEDIRVLGPKQASSSIDTASVAQNKLEQILNEDIGVCTHINRDKSSSDSKGIPHVKLDHLLNDKIEFNTGGGIVQSNNRALTSRLETWLYI